MLGADIGDQTWNLSAGMNHASTPSPHIPPQDIFRKQNTGIHFDGRHIQGQFLKLFGELGFGFFFVTSWTHESFPWQLAAGVSMIDG